MKTFTLLLLSFFPAGVPAQDTQPAKQAAVPNQVPVYNLDFKAEKPVPGFAAPAAIAQPIHCSPDGATFLNALVPPDFSSSSVTSISEKEVVGFSVQKIADLQNVRSLDYFPSAKHLHLLVYAAPKTSDGTVPSPASYHQYIAEFDRKGEYKKSIKVPSAIHVYRFAVLPSGNFLLSGFDPANNVASLVLMSPEGEILRPLELPEDLQQTKELNRREQNSKEPASLIASRMFSQEIFAAEGQGIVSWHPGSATVLAITGDSTAAEVKIQAPRDYSLDSFIPSDSSWIVNFKRSSLPADSVVDSKASTGNFVTYQVDSHDGSLIRELHPADNSPAWIACAREGKLTAFKMDQKSNFIHLSADIPK